MPEKKICPKCKSGNIYVLLNGDIVCRACGYDGRRPSEKKVEEKNETRK